MIRWNDVIGRLSQTPNRVRGCAEGTLAAFLGVAAASDVSERRNRDHTVVSRFLTRHSQESQASRQTH
jgi:hypothetical protein